MARALSEAQRRHLIELLDAPYWHPANAGEWVCAQALERRGLLIFNPSRGSKPYALTNAGRRAGEELRAAATGETPERTRPEEGT